MKAEVNAFERLYMVRGANSWCCGLKYRSCTLSSGKYVIGINLPGSPTWKPAGCAGTCSIPKASLYYPNMRNRTDALVINLATDEKHDDIDFTIPK